MERFLSEDSQKKKKKSCISTVACIPPSQQRKSTHGFGDDGDDIVRHPLPESNIGALDHLVPSANPLGDAEHL